MLDGWCDATITAVKGSPVPSIASETSEPGVSSIIYSYPRAASARVKTFFSISGVSSSPPLNGAAMKPRSSSPSTRITAFSTGTRHTAASYRS